MVMGVIIMDWKLIAIPLITTILTTIVLYVKENIDEKGKRDRTINEEKLKALYNELFSLSLIYTDKLEHSFYITPAGMFELDGESVPAEDTEMILDSEIWDELIIKIRAIIHKNLHLLEEDDLSLWHAIELSELEERFDKDRVNIQKYRQLEEFLTIITIKYKALYKKYHY